MQSQSYEEDLKKVETAFEKSTRIPTIKSARIFSVTPSQEGEDRQVQIQAIWSQVAPQAGNYVQFSTQYLIDVESLKHPEGIRFKELHGVNQALSRNTIEGVRDEVFIQIQKVWCDHVKADNEVLNLFKHGRLERCWNLTDVDLHGAVYFDHELGGIAISEDKTKIAYIAEAKRPKSKPFLKPANPNSESKTNKERPGKEYQFHDEFGEQMVGKSRPVIVILDVMKGQFEVLDQNDSFPDAWNPGQLSFCNNNNLIGIAIANQSRHLGLIYCSNRLGTVFSLNIETKKFQVLQPALGRNCQWPRVAKDYLIWMERDLDQLGWYPGPHMCAMRLMKLRIGDPSATPEVVVETRPNMRKVRYVGGKSEKFEFGGIFTDGLPQRCLDQGGEQVFFTNICVSTPVPVSINLISGDIVVGRAFQTILDVHDNIIVSSSSTPTSPPKLMASSILMEQFHAISRPQNEPILPGFEFLRFRSPAKNAHPDKRFSDVGISYLYIGPTSDSGDSIPVILWPHGGPHSVITTNFINNVYFFNLLGYGIILVNYRGSFGTSQDCIESLPGHIGDLDVKDCVQALDECLERFSFLSDKKVVLMGGSHGGFLVTHLAGQYPNRFKAVVARNPVINVASMATITDIPDWNCFESGSEFKFVSPSAEELTKMLDCSPIKYVQNVKAGIFLMIGKKDLRVPPSQGYEYYHNMKALGKKVHMNVYEDCHPLAKVLVNLDVMINAALFFNDILFKSNKD